jgi:hypothetical protein
MEATYNMIRIFKVVVIALLSISALFAPPLFKQGYGSVSLNSVFGLVGFYLVYLTYKEK